MTRSVRYWFPAVLWCAFIFLMSTDVFSSRHTGAVIGAVVHFMTQKIQSQRIEMIDEIVRKFAHIAEYFILGIFLFRAFHLGSKGERVWRSALFAVAVIVLYAAGDEFHQSFVPTRTASFTDVGVDSAGGVMAQIVSILWWKKPGPA